MENSKTAKLEYNSQAKAAAQAGPIPKGIPYITPALSEVFSSLASAAFYAERERGDVGIGPAGADKLSI